jgi:hypothetical protein
MVAGFAEMKIMEFDGVEIMKRFDEETRTLQFFARCRSWVHQAKFNSLIPKVFESLKYLRTFSPFWVSS